MESTRNRFFLPKIFSLVFFGVLLQSVALSQTCLTSDEIDAANRTALQNTATRFFDMIAHGDLASLKQNSIPAVATNFASIEGTIQNDQSNLAGGHAMPRAPFELKAEGTAPLPKADFLCGVFSATGQTANSAEFSIPNLPPGTYGVVILDVTTTKQSYTVSFVLEQQGTDWKLAGLFIRPAQSGGHDSAWFLNRAREFKSKGQMHNAWLYFTQGRELAISVPFMYTQATDKLYDEQQTLKPADFPVDGKTAALTASGGKTYTLTAIFPVTVGDNLDLVVKYQNPDVSNSGQTFQENVAVMKALVAKFPELRDAFAGIVARGVEPSGKDYGTMMPMSDIK